MQTKGPYTYGDKTFRTLGAITQHIKDVLDYDNRVVGREFFDDVLADVVVERHYRWRHRGIRPTSFKFMPSEAGDNRAWGDSLAGLFGAYGWQRFSYKKAVRKKQPTLESELPRICRQRWSSHWRPSLLPLGKVCENEKCPALATDVDHVAPQHKTIVAACWALLSAEDKKAWWHVLVEEPPGAPHFVLPEGHPVTCLYDTMTAAGGYQCLCAVHHREATRMRKE